MCSGNAILQSTKPACRMRIADCGIRKLQAKPRDELLNRFLIFHLTFSTTSLERVQRRMIRVTRVIIRTTFSRVRP